MGNKSKLYSLFLLDYFCFIYVFIFLHLLEYLRVSGLESFLLKWCLLAGISYHTDNSGLGLISIQNNEKSLESVLVSSWDGPLKFLPLFVSSTSLYKSPPTLKEAHAE